MYESQTGAFPPRREICKLFQGSKVVNPGARIRKVLAEPPYVWVPKPEGDANEPRFPIRPHAAPGGDGGL